MITLTQFIPLPSPFKRAREEHKRRLNTILLISYYRTYGPSAISSMGYRPLTPTDGVDFHY